METEEDERWKGKQNSEEEVRGRGWAYITVKNARGTSAVYTSSTIDRLQREGGEGWRCWWCWRRLDTALFYLPLKLERVGEEKRPVDGGFRSRHGNANDGLNEALTNRSPPPFFESACTSSDLHLLFLCVIGTSVAPDGPRGGGGYNNGGPVLARQRSKSFFAALFRINYIRLARTTRRAALRFLPTLCERITEYYIRASIEKERRDSGGKNIRWNRKWRGTKTLEELVFVQKLKGNRLRVFIKLLIESQCVQYSREKFGNLNESRG